MEQAKEAGKEHKIKDAYAPVKVRDSEPMPVRQNLSDSPKREPEEITIMLSTMTSNIIRLFTESALS